MLIHLMPAICTDNPFALRNLSHIFSVCGVLLLMFMAIMFFFLFKRLTRGTLYHWLFIGVTLVGSIYAFFLAVRTDHDLLICSFGPVASLSAFQALSILVSSITLLLLPTGIGILIMKRKTSDTADRGEQSFL